MEKETRSLLGWEEKLERISVIDGRIRKLKDQVKDFEKLKAPLEKDMKKALEDFDQGVAQGYIVSYNRATTHRFDSKALQAERCPAASSSSIRRKARRLMNSIFNQKKLKERRV